MAISMTIDGLRAAVSGKVLEPTDEGFDEARQSFNAMIDRRPAVIVQPRTTAEVASAVRYARSVDLPVGVRGGGHSVAGHAVPADALVVDLRLMRSVSVDPDARLARAEGGALWEDLDRATTAHGLATTGGTFVDTGIAGLTLGGGLGFILGTAGLTCDNLVAATVVTADGSIVQAGPDGDAELLWALRGGGGNFGIVTEFVYSLHRLGPIQAGAITFPLSEAQPALTAVAAFAQSMPDEMVIFIVGPTTLERQPEGEPLVAPRDYLRLAVIYQGSPEAAVAAVEPLARLPQAVTTFQPASYLDVQMAGGILPFGLRHYWKGHFVRDLDAGAIEAVATGMATVPSETSFMLLEGITGRARSEPEGGAAFGQREARWNVSALAIWEDPAADEAEIGWVRRTAEQLKPSSLTGAGYGNYAPVDETADRVRASFGPERFARLQAIKRRLDPDNVFRFNLNVPPG